MANIVIENESRIADIVFNDDEQFMVVTEKDVAETRWSMIVETIVKDVNTDNLYKVSWNRALTEFQDHEFNDLELVEVEKKTRIIEQVFYEPVAK